MWASTEVELPRETMDLVVASGLSCVTVVIRFLTWRELAGALRGSTKVPGRWREELEQRHRRERLALGKAHFEEAAKAAGCGVHIPYDPLSITGNSGAGAGAATAGASAQKPIVNNRHADVETSLRSTQIYGSLTLFALVHMMTTMAIEARCRRDTEPPDILGSRLVNSIIISPTTVAI